MCGWARHTASFRFFFFTLYMAGYLWGEGRALSGDIMGACIFCRILKGVSNLGKSKEALFLSTRSKWAWGLMECPSQGLGCPMGQGQPLWSQRPPQVHSVDAGRKTQHSVLGVRLVLTFFQSSRAVPSTHRTLSRPVKPNNRASWSLNEGGWYAVSGWEGGEQGSRE